MSSLMKDYHYSYTSALAESLAFGRAMRACALEQNPMLSIKRSTDGYIAQEVERIIHG